MTTMIQVENATKAFTLSYQRSLKQTVLAKTRGRKTHDTFNAVDDVTFSVREGESVGLMGLNGSGKSTLLKLISGVMRPDSGTVLTRGRIAGLIATGTGFDNNLSGRENLYLNAAILGMSRAETLAVGDRPFKRKCKKRMDEIVASGVTMFYVSHAPGSVRNLCNRVLVMENGRLGFDGDVEEGIHYLHYDESDEDNGEDDGLGADI